MIEICENVTQGKHCHVPERLKQDQECAHGRKWFEMDSNNSQELLLVKIVFRLGEGKDVCRTCKGLEFMMHFKTIEKRLKTETKHSGFKIFAQNQLSMRSVNLKGLLFSVGIRDMMEWQECRPIGTPEHFET